MAVFCCESKPSRTTLAVIASAILGVVAALLQITAIITVTPAFLWVTFGVAVGYLAVLLGSAGCCLRGMPCGCGSTLNAVMAGIVGTVLLSVVLLAVTFAATSIVGAIVVGLLVLFFFLTLFGTASLVRCLTNVQN